MKKNEDYCPTFLEIERELDTIHQGHKKTQRDREQHVCGIRSGYATFFQKNVTNSKFGQRRKRKKCFTTLPDDDNSSLQKVWNILQTADGSVVTHLNVVVVVVVALLFFWGGEFEKKIDARAHFHPVAISLLMTGSLVKIQIADVLLTRYTITPYRH